MTEAERDWADALAREFMNAAVDRDNQEIITQWIATRLRTLKAKAQSEAIIAATEEMKKVFNEHGVGGGDK